MAGDNEARTKPQHTQKAKVKSGCATCKIRKVKCDEVRPACHRCTSTGRKCDGYGIWQNYHPPRKEVANEEHPPQDVARREPNSLAARPLAFVAVVAAGTQERSHFEWFQCKTVIKLPGSYRSQFWDLLLLQASLNEPAVMHGVLALSSAHKNLVLLRGNETDDQTCRNAAPIDYDQLAVKHYLKAIAQLHTHSIGKDRTSFRVTLITCVVFICFELLRGHFETAHTHLDNGLRILQESRILRCNNDKGLRAGLLTDEWIGSAFVRLQLQAQLLKDWTRAPSPHALPLAPVYAFVSLNDAWQQIGWLLDRIRHLARQVSKPAERDAEVVEERLDLLHCQQSMRPELTRWLDMYQVFTDGRLQSPHATLEMVKAFQMLHAYHTMATIMVETCLTPNDEMAYDLQTSAFQLILEQSAKVLTAGEPTNEIRIYHADMSHAITDFGWLVPLYYTATKCRVHSIRLRAVELLQHTTHREGFWDAVATARAARKIMELEEQDFYHPTDSPCDCIPSSSSDLRHTSLPILPDSHRLQGVEMSLLGAPLEKISLSCRRQVNDIDRKILLSEYNITTRCWVDVPRLSEDRRRRQENVNTVALTELRTVGKV